MEKIVDRYNRGIDYIRFSVTGQCNLNCFYCHKEGIKSVEHELTIEEIETLFKKSSDFGIKSIKLTGGEPLQRKDIIEIVKIASKYFEDVSMTTNGIGLDSIAEDLYESGLKRINISMHTLKSEIYRKITGKDSHDMVLKSILKVSGIPFKKKKINMVYLNGLNDEEIKDMIGFAANMDFTLQVIEFEASREDVNRELFKKYHKNLDNVREFLNKYEYKKTLKPLHHREIYTINFNGNEVEIELVEPMFKHDFCMNCTRLRITPDGKFKPCIFRNDNLVDGFIDNALKIAVNLREPYW
ncbi:MAG: GTP 3',8-cyclase MoaA [Thermoplasmata archaeon]